MSPLNSGNLKNEGSSSLLFLNSISDGFKAAVTTLYSDFKYDLISPK